MSHRRSLVASVLPGVLVALAGSGASLGAGPFGAIVMLSALDGTDGFVCIGAAASDFSGRPVAPVGDVNGDGYDDIIIGAYRADLTPNGNQGKAYVLFGGPGIGATGVFPLASVNGTNGFVINGIDAGDDCGRGLAGVGDVNGDGIDDILIGARSADPNGQNAAGECYVVFGKVGLGASGSLNLSTLNGTNGFVINGKFPGDQVGEALSSAGDFNGDGIDDILIGAAPADPSGRVSAGECYLVYGRVGLGASGVLNLSTLDGTTGFVMQGVDAGDDTGFSVSSAGDFNGDGNGDIVIGAPDATPGTLANAGAAYVVYGGASAAPSGVFTLSFIGSGTGCKIGGAAVNDSCGESVSCAGDVNGDGFDDIVIGSPLADPNGLSTSGEAYIVFGGPGVGASGLVSLSTLSASAGYRCRSGASDDRLGHWVSGGRDFNDDGYSDVVMSAPFADSHGQGSNGATYIVFGGPSLGISTIKNLHTSTGAAGFVCRGEKSTDYSGIVTSPVGDINGDGIEDVMTSAHFANYAGEFGVGKTYIVFGRPGNVWSSSSSGSWATGSNWVGEFAPTGGSVEIEPMFGGLVEGPVGTADLRRLTLGAQFGRTMLDLRPDSVVTVEQALTIPNSGGVSGFGVLACSGQVSNTGLIVMDDLMVVTAGGLVNATVGDIGVNQGFISGTVINSGLIDITPDAPGTGTAALDVDGVVSNETSGLIFLRHGTADLWTSPGMFNAGQIGIADADATIFGTVTNTGAPDGFGGYTPVGAINVIANSVVLFADDVVNQSGITVDASSALAVFGTLFGNGVSGPGGVGAAGAVYLEGGVSPGFSAGIARFGGDATLGGSAITTVEIGGTAPGTQHDQVAVAGVLSVSGTLRVVMTGGYTPRPGDAYTVLDFGSVIGTFGAIELDPALIARNADVSTLLIDGTIRIPAPNCAGDVNIDGSTNVADFTILAGSFGSAVTPGTDGDLNGDGLVNAADFVILAGDFGCAP